LPRAAPILAVLAALVPPPAGAEAYACQGTAPDWRLDVAAGTARLVFPAPTEMRVRLTTPAQGRDWPRALTLIGARDTAILVLTRGTCRVAGQDRPLFAHVLTQRGQTPILLTGCCETGE